jgi:hypothetical protein
MHWLTQLHAVRIRAGGPDRGARHEDGFSQASAARTSLIWKASRGEPEEPPMQDLSALTPPLLVCAVVIIAIVAFLRHEMGRSRRTGSADDAESTTESPTGDEAAGTGPGTPPDERRTGVEGQQRRP